MHAAPSTPASASTELRVIDIPPNAGRRVFVTLHGADLRTQNRRTLALAPRGNSPVREYAAPYQDTGDELVAHGRMFFFFDHASGPTRS